MSHSRTIALLFTDLVGSTELSTRLGREGADRLRRAHFALLREALDEAGGQEVKSLGDGLMVSFASVGAAVAGAVGMQQRIEQRNRTAAPPLAVRIGVAVGDALREERDWFGPPAVEASRLCAAAGGGQILASEAVALLAPADGPALTPIGPLELKGLPGPRPVHRVEWEPLPPEPGLLTLPPALCDVPRTGFVGRIPERERLAAAWAAARDGDRRLVLLSGEPGIGKTRLAAQLAGEARRSGGIVLYGRCEEEVGPAYGPWRQALGHLVDAGPASLLRRHVERHGGELARLAPALAVRLDGVPQPQASQPETERYLLFGAVLGLLEEAARAAPVLLVLDDLHWAGRPTLALLRHLHAAGPAVPLLVVAAHRAAGLGGGHPLAELLGELRREPAVERLALEGLGEGEVVALIEAAAGHALDRPGTALAHELRQQTGGNPFYLAEMVRHLAESGAIRRDDDGRWTAPDGVAALTLPHSVHEVIGGRVARLGSDAARVLGTAAVIGRDFELDLLARVGGIDPDAALDVLEAAVGAALVAEAPGRPGRFSFVHALVSHALSATLSGARRARLHERVALALEEGVDGDADLAQLALHWAAAAGPAAHGRARHYAVRAGRQALAQLAPDEAVRRFGHGLELHDAARGADPAERRELLLGLGEAQQQAGMPEFRETLLQAAALAREAGDADRVVRAALANSRGYFSATGFVDEERVAVLEAALEGAAPDDARRARLLALLAAELLWSGDHVRRRELADEALALARRGGDAAALAHVLTLRVAAAWTPANLDERCGDMEELVALADTLDDPVQRFWALVWRAMTIVQAGDLTGGDACLAELRGLTARLGQPRLRFVLGTQETWRAALAGRLEEAERCADATATLGLESGEPDALSLYAAQIGPIRWQQSRLDEVFELVEQIALEVPAVSVFGALRAAAELDAGHRPMARGLLDAAAGDGFTALPHDPVRLCSLVVWAEVAARLGATGAAADLLDALEPCREQVVVNALAAFGSVGRACGMLAAALGRQAEADAHFAQALADHERLGAAAFSVRTRLDWGEALSRGTRPGDALRARELLAEATSAARALGLAGLARRAERAVLDAQAMRVALRPSEGG